jgi:predicted nucleic acid-binding protein
MYIFLGTNIVIDFLDSARPKHRIVEKLIQKIISTGYDIMISEDMISTIFYLIKNKQKTLQQLEIIREEWKIVHFGNIIIKNSIDLSLENNLDLEDTLQCLCAIENNCDVLVTNDNEFHNCGIKVQTPQQFLND